LFERKAPEVTKLHQVSDVSVLVSEPSERFIQRDQIFRLILDGYGQIVQVDLLPAPTAPFASFASGVVDEQSPHGFSGRSEEMAAIAPVSPLVCDQPDIRLVIKGGRLKRLTGRLSRELLGRQETQFVIDKGQKSVRRLAVSLFDRI
jgi:hypothetical protein